MENLNLQKFIMPHSGFSCLLPPFTCICEQYSHFSTHPRWTKPSNAQPLQHVQSALSFSLGQSHNFFRIIKDLYCTLDVMDMVCFYQFFARICIIIQQFNISLCSVTKGEALTEYFAITSYAIFHLTQVFIQELRNFNINHY